MQTNKILFEGFLEHGLHWMKVSHLMEEVE